MRRILNIEIYKLVGPDSLILDLRIWMGNVCNRLLPGNAAIARGLTCCKNLFSISFGFKKIMVNKITPRAGKPYLAHNLLRCKIYLAKIINIHFSYQNPRKCISVES